MSKYMQVLGRKPGKFNWGQALGIGMQGAGKYYGDVAIEKKKAQARAEAAAAKAAEKEDDRAHEKEVLDEQRAYEAGLKGEQREYDESQEAERRAYEEGRLAAKQERDDELRDEGRAHDLTLGALTETQIINGEARKVRLNQNGELIKDLGPDPDYAVNDEGQLVKLSAGGKGASNKQTESQMKMSLHGQNFNASLDGIDSILKTYDLGSVEALTARATDRVPLGNYFQSGESQQFNFHAKRAAESLFKGESGAAGSDAEAARYRSFLPMAGDLPETVQAKMEIARGIAARMEEMAQAGMSRDQQVLEARDIAIETAFKLGWEVDLEDPKSILKPPSASSQSNEDLFNQADAIIYGRGT